MSSVPAASFKPKSLAATAGIFWRDCAEQKLPDTQSIPVSSVLSFAPKSLAAISGSFDLTVRSGNLEIYTICLRFPLLHLSQNRSLQSADLFLRLFAVISECRVGACPHRCTCGAAQLGPLKICGIFSRYLSLIHPALAVGASPHPTKSCFDSEGIICNPQFGIDNCIRLLF